MAPKDKSYGADSNGRGISVQTLEKEDTLGQEKGRGTNEGSQQKLLLTPQKGRGVRVEISLLIKTAKMLGKSGREKWYTGQKNPTIRNKVIH